MKTGLPGSITWFALILAAATIPGCAEIKSRWSEINPGVVIQAEDPGSQDRVVVSQPVLEPAAVACGQKVSYRAAYTLFSADKGKEFDVLEAVTLSGSNLRIELSRKASKKLPGSHLLAFEFTVPPDLPPGPYELTGTIKAAGQEKKQVSGFTLKR